MFAVVDERAESRQSAFLVFGLVSGFGALNQNLLSFSRHGVLPRIAETHSGFHFVHVLSAGAAGAEGVPFDFTFVDDHVKGFCFRQDCDGRGRGVDTPLRLGGRHALHSVHTALVFQHAIDSFPGHGANNFLETSGSTFARTRNLQLPAFLLAELGVHSEKVAGKESRFVAPRSAAYFQNRIASVLGVVGDEHETNFLFQFREFLFAGSQLLSRHLLHVGVIVV